MRIVAKNLKSVRQRIESAAKLAGRRPEEVQLVAVTKNRTIEQIAALVEAGQRVFGENRLQEALPKIEALSGRAEWQMIGHLQTNKAKQAAGAGFSLIHSADSERILAALDKASKSNAEPTRVLLQVNTSGEEQKSGCRPDEALELFERAESMPGIELRGLMTMAAFSRDPEQARPAFRALGKLRDELEASGIAQERLRHLSMGMSGDFEAAIEEGATLVRVGSALFEGLS